MRLEEHPLNEQVAMYKQFIEDIALIWIDMWGAYGEKVTVYTKEENSPLIRKDTINKQALQKVRMNIKVETSATSPFSKYAREQTLMMFMQEQRITFEEYVDMLDEGSTTPKSKLQAHTAQTDTTGYGRYGRWGRGQHALRRLHRGRRRVYTNAKRDGGGSRERTEHDGCRAEQQGLQCHR